MMVTGTFTGVKDPHGWDGIFSFDGVHPSYPKSYQDDYSTEGLSHCGYGLRNYMTLRKYAEVLQALQGQLPRLVHRPHPSDA